MKSYQMLLTSILGFFARLVARFVCLLGWPVTLMAMFYVFELARPSLSSGVIPVATGSMIWNSSRDPILISHLTDLHVSPLYNETGVKRVERALDFISRNVNSTLTVLTGDLTDNIETISHLGVSRPIEEHWEMYSEIIRNCGIERDQLVEILGNHDTWGRSRFADKYFDYMLRPPTHENWYSQSFERGDVRVVSFVPITFPTGRTIYLFIPTIYPWMLEILEDELAKPTTCTTTVVASHFTTGMMFPVNKARSRKTGMNLKEILAAHNVDVFLSGHTHPPNGWDYCHFGKSIELTGTALQVDEGFSVLTFDNGRLGYAIVDPTKEKVAVVTSPGRDELATKIFDNEEFEVRVVSFTEEAKNFSVSGAVEGNLMFDHTMEDGNDLYSMKVALPKGSYSITISGDLDQVVNFSVGVEAGPFMEEKFIDLSAWEFLVWFCFAIAYQLAVWTSVFCFPESLKPRFEACLSWMNGASHGVSIPVILSGPLFAGFYLNKVPKAAKIAALVMVVAPIVIPMGITRMEDVVSIQYFIGFIAGGSYKYEVLAHAFGVYFWIAICGGFEAFIGLSLFRFSCGMLLDMFAIVLLVLQALNLWEMYGRDRYVDGTILRVSFVFHVIPTIMTGVCVWLIGRRLIGKAKLD